LPIDRGGFFCGCECFVALPNLGQSKSEVVQRPGEVREVGVWVDFGNAAVDGNGFLSRPECVFAPSDFGQADS
jgi:hypothetical protein